MTRPSWIGKTLGGRYRIDDILGQGGMSAVYKAFDPNLRRVVAIKLIHSHLAGDPKFLARFEEEAAAVAQLRHPNIVQVFDFNHDDDLYYMVQEFVAGETLQERLRRLTKSGRHMQLGEAIGYIMNICDATGYAHNRGLVHRDIKPANIMIDIHGQAILMDFGIVKIMGGEKHTATGAVVGTALYLAPEAIRGETPDARSDQYSLGITLFEAVSGRPPYEADSAMTLMMMHLNDPLPDLRQLRPDVPANLAAVIEKSLAKRREDRYASMAEFASALRAVQGSLGSTAPAVTQLDQTGQPGSQTVPETSIPAPASWQPSPIEPVGRPASPPTMPPVPSQKPATAGRIPPAASSAGQGLPVPGAASSSNTSYSAPSPAAPPRPLPKWAFWAGIGGIGGIMLLAVIGILFALRGMGAARSTPVAPAATIAPTATQAVQAALPTVQPSATLAPTSAPSATAISEPAATPTITPSPTPTIPVGVLYSRINAITINDAGQYVVDYETFEYTEIVPGQHVHFFFNTVSQEQAGNPGSGPWILYGGPRPFTDYRTAVRPEKATQMCIRVANTNHSIILDSGNCFTLPDVNAAVPVFDDPCLVGPGPAYPSLGVLEAGQVLLVTGISSDEAWWTVESPAYPNQTCWLQRARADFSGDLSILPLAETPTLPESTPADLFVQIDRITLDDQNRYAVEFTPRGFTPALPGTHMHFFYDIYASEQVGSAAGGNRLMYGGASPFTGFNQADRPADAAQLCVLVANPNHSVIEGSGNCAPLPDVGPALSFSTILEQARSKPVTFQDGFADNHNNWPSGVESSAVYGSLQCSISDDRYFLNIDGLEPTVWWVSGDMPGVADFYLAASVRQVSGSPTNEYGLVFRKTSDQDYLVYKVNENGRYALYQFQDATWTALIDWTDTSALKVGEENRMEVIAQGSLLYLVLNGELVAQYTSADLGDGKAGLFVGTSNSGEKGLWEFDNFEVRLLD